MNRIIFALLFIFVSNQSESKQVTMIYKKADLVLSAMKDAFNSQSVSESTKSKLIYNIEIIAKLTSDRQSNLMKDQLYIRSLIKQKNMAEAKSIQDKISAILSNNETFEFSPFSPSELASMPSNDASVISAAQN